MQNTEYFSTAKKNFEQPWNHLHSCILQNFLILFKTWSHNSSQKFLSFSSEWNKKKSNNSNSKINKQTENATKTTVQKCWKVGLCNQDSSSSSNSTELHSLKTFIQHREHMLILLLPFSKSKMSGMKWKLNQKTHKQI